MEKREHLSPEGLERILDLKAKMEALRA